MIYARRDGRGGVLRGSTSATNRSLELQGLNKYIMYRVQVLAFTIRGDGLLSDQVFCTTDQDGRMNDTCCCVLLFALTTLCKNSYSYSPVLIHEIVKL